jgi:hypothetical protein
MARAKGSPPAARRPRRYVTDPHRPGLARAFTRWARGHGLDLTRVSEEQRTVLEAVRRFLDWSGRRPLFVRIAFLVLLHVRLRFPRPLLRAVLGRAVTDKSALRRLTPAQAAARLTAPDGRRDPGKRRRLTVAHVGPIARFLTAGPTTVAALHRWLTTGPLGLRITRPRLYPALRRLGLDALLAPWGQRKKGALRASTAPSTPAPSS